MEADLHGIFFPVWKIHLALQKMSFKKLSWENWSRWGLSKLLFHRLTRWQEEKCQNHKATVRRWTSLKFKVTSTRRFNLFQRCKELSCFSHNIWRCSQSNLSCKDSVQGLLVIVCYHGWKRSNWKPVVGPTYLVCPWTVVITSVQLHIPFLNTLLSAASDCNFNERTCCPLA